MALIASHIIVIIILMMMTVLGIVGRVKCACLVAVDHTCRDLAEISAVRPRRDLADELVGVCHVRGSSRAFGSRLVILHVHSSCVYRQTKHDFKRR